MKKLIYLFFGILLLSNLNLAAQKTKISGGTGSISNIEIRKKCLLEGIVLGKNGQPLKEVEINILNNETLEFIEKIKTNKKGIYQVELVNNKSYLIKLIKYDYGKKFSTNANPCHGNKINLDINLSKERQGSDSNIDITSAITEKPQSNKLIPPKICFDRKLNNSVYQSAEVAVKFDIIITGNNYEKLDIRHNNNLIKEEEEIVRAAELRKITVKIKLVKGKNELKITAYGKAGSISETKIINLRYEPPIFKYYALLIAVEKYKNEHIEDLEFPVNDVNIFKELLKTKYTFEEENIRVLTNPSELEIDSTFSDLENELLGKKNVNLLVFYAGHGHYDDDSEQGYWLPSDADLTKKYTWFRNSTIRDYIGSISAKHILLISDNCFSGSISGRSALLDTEDTGIESLMNKPSRKVMTSGTKKEIVPDKSYFFKYLTQELTNNTKDYLSAGTLYEAIKMPIMNRNPDQTPQYEIFEQGHKGGEFIFHKRK